MKVTIDGKHTGLTARFLDPAWFEDWLKESSDIQMKNEAASLEWRATGNHRRFGRFIAKWFIGAGGKAGELIVAATEF